MHDQPTCGPELSPVELDERNRNDVLQHLLFEYPTPFSVDELIAELTSPGETSFGERDGFLNAIRDLRNAIRDLRQAALLHQHGEFAVRSAGVR